MANHVVLMEPWWNPAVEDQAIDRAHRYASTSLMSDHSLIIPYSVTESARQKKFTSTAFWCLIASTTGSERSVPSSDDVQAKYMFNSLLLTGTRKEGQESL